MSRENGTPWLRVVPPGEIEGEGGGNREALLQAARAGAGDFEILGEMAHGDGNATVYLARELKTAKLVALRFEPGEEGSRALTVLREVDEASLATPLRPAPALPPVVQPPRAQPTPYRGSAQAVLIPSDEAPRDEVLPPRPPRRLPGQVLAAGGIVLAAAVVLGALVQSRLSVPDGTRAGAVSGAEAGRAGGASAPVMAAGSGRLQVVADLPRGARVLVNGVAIDSMSVALAPGTYTVAITAPGYVPVAEALRILASQTVVWTPTFTPSSISGDGGASEKVTRSTSAPAAKPDSKSRTTSAKRVAVADTPSAPPPAPTCASATQDRSWSAAVAPCTSEAEAGNIAAEQMLGLMYDQGLGVAKDPGRAITWSRKAADAGSREAAARLGSIYENGRGVPQNVGEAMAWYRKAATLGDPDAQLKIAKAYESGTGVPKNLDEAISWYRKAADLGNARAQNYLGWLYGNGHGVKRDDRHAVDWFRRAAEQGDAQAQYNLGFMYANGRGVSRDDDQAVTWFRRAARQGYREALDELDRRGINP
jgi:TPR repeat protein